MDRTIRSDIFSLKPVHTICSILGIAPRIDDNFDHGITYPLIVLAAITASTCFSIHWDIVNRDSDFSKSIKIADVLMDIWTPLVTSFFVIHFRIMNRKRFVNFIKLFASIDAKLKPGAPGKRAHRTFLLELILFNAYFFSFTLYMIYFFVHEFNVLEIFSQCLKIVHTYSMLMFSLLIRYYALSIKYRFETVNECLRRLEDYRKMKSLCVVSESLTKIVLLFEDFNELFGWHIFGYYLTTQFSILCLVNELIISFRKIEGLETSSFGVIFTAFYVLTGSLFMLMTWAIYSACDQAHRQAEMFPKICYLVKKSLRNVLLQSQLNELAQEAVNSSMEFTAAGFFNVKYTTVFGLVGSLSSYIIILIQLNNL